MSMPPIPRLRPSVGGMCRNITMLRGLQPPATAEEIEAAARQYVRKVGGVQTVSAATEEAFERAVQAVTEASSRLLRELVTTAPPRDRQREIERARERNAVRFGPRTA